MATSPRRIVSLLPGATEILFALGLGDRVVGVSHECDWPRAARSLPRLTRTTIDSSRPSAEIDRQVAELLATGQALYQVDNELLEKLAPDLIVTQAQCDVCAVKLADVEGAVDRCGLAGKARIVTLLPRLLGDILDDIARVAVVAGVAETGARVVADLKARIAAVEREVAPVPIAERPRVAAIEWLEPIMLAGNWMPELIAKAGGRSLVETWAAPSEYCEWSAIAASDPEVILLMPCGFDLARGEEEAQSLARREGWQNSRAVKSGRVYAVDGNAWFNRAGPRSIESLEILAHLLHPERMPPPRIDYDQPAYARVNQ